MKEQNKKEVYAIITNKNYGLYAGIVESFDPVNGVHLSHVEVFP